jgi:hypothetical protein
MRRAEDRNQDFLAFGPVQEQSSANWRSGCARFVLSGVCVFGERPIARVCVCGQRKRRLTGVLESGADAFVCGELKYHR